MKSLHEKGYSLRPLCELLGLDFNDYIANSKYEIEDLKLRETIVPPLSTYTMTGSDVAGSPTDTSNENENTVTSKENGANSTPKANV